MRILYDATPLLLRSAGVKNYHYLLLRHLLPLAAPHTIELFPFLRNPGRNRNEGSNYPPVATALRLSVWLADNYLRVPVGRWAGRRADLFHLTQHLLHPTAVGQRLRLTSFIHDLSCLLMPQYHTASNVRYFRHFARDVLPRLAGVLVPSHAVEQELIEHLGVAPERVNVVPHGVEQRFFQPGPFEAALKAYGLPERYILFVGAAEPRKNVSTLLEACRLLPADLRRDYPLVLAGASGWKNAALWEAVERDRPIGVRPIGYVAPELLPAVYKQAAVFVFPSLYEGFGLPLLEAMAAGTPVVTSNVSAMPEVVGEAGLTVDPRSPAELARAIEHLLSDRALAAQLAEAGRRRAREFTWGKTALATKAFFDHLA
ncbi:MAG: glycosyltransferase family 4 protein [Acidobacteria bacterium]|nr:glycosyltransferase family 4 protein [Acidobacteriota bacterium]